MYKISNYIIIQKRKEILDIITYFQIISQYKVSKENYKKLILCATNNTFTVNFKRNRGNFQLSGSSILTFCEEITVILKSKCKQKT